MKRTPWFPATIKPRCNGWYEIQTKSLGCTCCCMDAYWNGRKFVRYGLLAGILRTCEAFRDVTQWRGLAKPPKEPK